MSWFARVRSGLNWRVGLLALGLVFVIEYAVSNQYWYYQQSTGPRRVSRWTGHVEAWQLEYHPSDVYKTGPSRWRWVRFQ